MSDESLGDFLDRHVDDAYYRFIFENSLDAILLTCPDGCIYKANPAAEKMFQLSEAELCSIGRAGVVDMNDPRLPEALHQRETNGYARAEINFKRKDGTIFPGDVTSSFFIDENSVVWSAIIIRDVSVYKEIEKSLRQANAEAIYFAMHDFLTGVLNRRVFLEKLLVEIERCKRNKTAMSLLMLDIDHFKLINDTLGHFAGDRVLKSIATALQSVLRPYDLLGRYGGDEFTICLPSTDHVNAAGISERLRLIIEKLEIPYENEIIKTTISIGVASHNPYDNEESNDIIARADKHLYKAKEYKNCIVTDEQAFRL